MTADDQPDGAPHAAGQREAERDDLGASLRGLSLLSSARLPLPEVLTRIARYAVQAIPGADGAGLTLLEHHRSDTIVQTADFVGEVDAIQYGVGEGPCITAARDAVTVISGSIGGDPRWPRFGGRVARLGVHSAISLPLVTPDEVVGAMNVYAFAKNAFDARAAELGEVFAVPAAVAVQNAWVLEDARRLSERLQRILDERMVIERAVGIVMSRSGVDEDEARARLTRLSQHEHVKLVQVARTLVEEAARRARSRPHERPLD